MSKTARYTFTGQTAEAVADIARAYEAERDALAARVEELEAVVKGDEPHDGRWFVGIAEGGGLHRAWPVDAEGQEGAAALFGGAARIIAVVPSAKLTEAQRNVEELEARIARADKALGFRWWGTETPAVAEARRILRGEDDTS